MHLGRRGIHFEIKSQRTLREPRSVSQIRRENPLFVTRTITHRSTRRPAEIRARSRRATSAGGKYLAPIRLSIFPRVSCFPPPPPPPSLVDDGEERGEANPRGLGRRANGASGQGEVGRGIRGGGGGWLSETLGPNDQCHGAFIVLQQKGAHQSTGISSRLISRGRLPPPPLEFPRFHPRSRKPPATASAATRPPRLLSLSAPEAPSRVLHLPSSDLPPPPARPTPPAPSPFPAGAGGYRG